MKRIGLVVVACLAVIACAPNRPVGPSPSSGTSSSGSGALTCADACSHKKQLGCASAAETDAGGTCEQVCMNARTTGLGYADLECRVRAVDCATAEACP